MQVSIIIPIYNVEKYLEDCLNSIKNQQFQNYEVLMVNDGSPDNCHEICQRFAASDERFKYFWQENRGVSAARNNGLSHATGKYIYFMDPDDTFSPDFLEAMYEEAERTNADFVINASVLFSLTPPKEFDLAKTVPGHYDTNLENYFVNGYLWFKLLRRDLIERANVKFVEGCHYREDELFGLMLYPYAKNYSLIKQGYYYYRQHGESALAKVVKNRQKYGESMTIFLSRIFNFYKERNLESYIPLAIKMLPFAHEWPNKQHYWKLMQSLNRQFDLEKWKSLMHILHQAAIRKRSYFSFLLNNWWLYNKGKLKKLRKKVFSIKLHKDYKLVRLFGITWWENSQRKTSTKKIA